MYPLRNLASLSSAFFFSLGIGTASLFPTYYHVFGILLGILLLFSLLLLLLFPKHKLNLYRYLLNLNPLLYLGVFLLGYLLYLIHLPAYQAKHFTHLYKENTPELVQIKIIEVQRTTSYYQQYIAQVLQINQTPTHGRILLRTALKDSISSFFPGQQVLLHLNIQALNTPKNPFDRELRDYYKSLSVFHSAYLNTNIRPIALASTAKTSWIWRNKALEALAKTSLQTHSKQLIQAMLLGYRDEWDIERRSNYSNAGVAHILAISGLHVGIFYTALFWLGLPLQLIWKNRLPVYAFCLLVLWAYAWFTGMSPSVSRSVSMLSFFVLARLIGRPAPTLHTLASSYLVLLFIKPHWLFHIGFQMSYTAVFFILWAYPKLQQLWYPKNSFVKRTWQLLLLTGVAQLGVMPWMLYYFGKIPGLFLLSNLILLSLISILFIGGLLILLLASIGIHQSWVFSVYDFLNSQIERHINWVAQQENFILLFNKPSLLKSLVFLLILLHLLPLLWKASYTSLRNLALGSILLSCLLGFYKQYYEKEEIWLLTQIGQSSLLHLRPKQAKLLTNQQEIQTTYIWSSIKSKYPNKKLSTQSFPEVFKINQNTFIKINPDFVYSPSLPPASILLLQDSFATDLNRLCALLNPKLVIADASNYPSKITEWKDICIKRKTPFLSTSEEGAIALNALKY